MTALWALVYAGGTVLAARFAEMHVAARKGDGISGPGVAGQAHGGPQGVAVLPDERTDDIPELYSAVNFRQVWSNFGDNAGDVGGQSSDGGPAHGAARQVSGTLFAHQLMLAVEQDHESF